MVPVFGLYTHIRANRIRSVLLVAGLFVLVLLVGYAVALALVALGDAAGAPPEVIARAALDTALLWSPFLVLGTLAWVGLSLGLNGRIVDATTGARTITREDDPRLYRMLETLCISRGMPTPRLKIVETDALNAYASGITQRQYAVTLTRGLVERLDEAELEAVMAHELTHIRNEDVRLMMVAVVVAGVIGLVGEIVFRSLRFGSLRRGSSRSRGSGGGGGGRGAAIAIVVAIVIILVAWIASLLIRFAISRAREYMADAGAVELTKNPDAMISALLKIKGNADIARAPASVMEMCVENPRRGFTALLATHPPIEDRIEALVRNAGGRLPAGAGVSS
ncbi:M48 family metalloprotease [Salinarimonas ramus]|uniref:Protease HtpX n=1 Tax=Salinarimonas ramus TaxID=690164 RepID=A0A917Q873_9HYPH|nr:M48 family metalloprotease [Salinarimonas ramus]GGK33634.1 protease HtpX [Salinarimonas ramus]